MSTAVARGKDDAAIPAGPREGWSEMDLREFHESGLLWHTNRAALWPLGLALSIEVDAAGEYQRLFVQRLDPFDAIASGDSPDEEVGRLDRLATWMKDRVR